MALRGIRGATTTAANTKEDIIERTRELLEEMVRVNDIRIEEIASALFSVTGDLDAEFPAVAARLIGWLHTPLFCTLEIPVPGSLGSCVRVLIHVNSEKPQDEMRHVYLHEAKSLRPDLGTKDADRFYVSNS